MKHTTTILLAIVAIASISIAARSAAPTPPAAPEYKVITIVESIVPMGIGRSRMVESITEMDTADATTERTDGKRSDQGKVRRKDLKIDNFTETKMLNFYSGVGINFQNIASNDAMITARINELSAEGWDLYHMASGVESEAGEGDGNGIYITRLVFRR